MPELVHPEWINHHLPYQPALFVGREKFLERIDQKVRQAQTGHRITRPVIRLRGLEGIGKTWLLKQIHHHYHDRSPVTTEDLNRPAVATYVTLPSSPGTIHIGELISELADSLHATLAPVLSDRQQAMLAKASRERETAVLVDILQQLCTRLTFIILIDHARLTDSSRNELEQTLIEPLAKTDRILIISAGPNNSPPWNQFEVKRRTDFPRYFPPLPPFDKELVERQIACRTYPIAAELLFPYTAGNPHLVDVTAQHILAWKEDIAIAPPDRHWLSEHRADLLQILLLVEKQMLGEIPKERHLSLESLSALRYFRLEALRFMLTKLQPRIGQQADGYYLGLLRSLDQETMLIWWNRDLRAYVADESIRRLINRREWLQNQQLFAQKHRLAYEMYWQWAQSFPQGAENYILEMCFHLANLYLTHKQEKQLQSSLNRLLSFADQHLSPDRFLALHKQFENDQEIHDLLPHHFHRKTAGQLELMLANKTS